MKRLNAAVSLFVFCASFAPPVLAPGPLAAKSHAAKSHAAKSHAAKPRAAKPAAVKLAKPSAIPLPDRNPMRPAAAAQTDSDAPAVEATGALASEPAPDQSKSMPAQPTATLTPPDANTTDVALPDRKPERPSAMPVASTAALTPPDANTTDVVLPARNPERPAATLQPPSNDQAAPSNDNEQATPTPSNDEATPSGASAPKLAYASILRPLLAYQLSASDAANLKDALGASFRGDDAGSHAATARISDSAARKLATWYEYRNGDLDAAADAIETFRIANPDWPGQDELRERAEIALFLADASPDKVRAFFGDAAPLTGAGKAALASAYLKDGNELSLIHI